MSGLLPWAVIAAAVLAGTVAEPHWPRQLGAALLWLGGWWRALLVPAALALLAAVLALHGSRVGSAWEATVRLGRALWRRLPGMCAAAIALAALTYAMGYLVPRAAVGALTLFVLQLGLFPGTPLIGLALAIVLGTLWLDRSGVSLFVLVRQRATAAWTARRHHAGLLARFAGVAMAAGMVGAVLLPDAMQGWGYVEGPDARKHNFYAAYFVYSAGSGDPREELREGFQPGLKGLALPPGGSGTVVYRLERPPESVVLLRPNFYHRRLREAGSSEMEEAWLQTALTGEAFSNALEIEVEGTPGYRTIFRDTSVGEITGNQVIDVSQFTGAARRYRLRFTATNTTSAEVTVLPSVVVSVTEDRRAAPSAVFPVLPYLAAAAVAVYATARVLGWRAPALTVLAVMLCAGAAARIAGDVWARATPGAQPAPEGTLEAALFDPAAPAEAGAALWVARVALALALAAAGAAALWRRRHGAVGLPWLALACLAVGALALDVRWDYLFRLRYENLVPDAQGYQAIANEFPSKMARYWTGRGSALLDALFDNGFDGKANAFAVFYAGGNNGREPGWPTLIRLVANVIGISAFHTRLTSLLCGSAVAVLTCWLGWRVLHPLAGVLAGVLVALHQAQAENSVAGLREELVAALLVLLFGLLFAGQRRGASAPPPRVMAAGATAAGLILVRGDMLVLAGMVMGLAALALRWRLREWVVAFGVMGALAGPMYVGYAFTHRDPFYPGTYGATVNRNLEFPERIGTPGFPTAEEFAGGWFSGPTISPMKYFFGYHTVPEFAAASVRGFIRIFRDVLFRGQPALLALCVIGAALLLARRRWVVPAAAVVSLMPFYAFMAGVPNVFAPRYAHHALPYAALATAYAITWLPLFLLPRPVRRSDPGGPASEPEASEEEQQGARPVAAGGLASGTLAR